jgi:hypothetical protein
MSAPEAERKVTVTVHAIDQYRDRRRFDDRHWRELEAEIIEQVRCGTARGNLLDRKPEGFVLYGQRLGKLPSGQRFVWCGDEPQFGFIVKRFPYEDVVVTTLVRVGVRR